MKTTGTYIPALRYHAFTSVYDPLIRWFLREDAFKGALIQQAQLEDGHRILDLACGTATLTMMVGEAQQNTEVYGLDADATILRISQHKLSRRESGILLLRGFSTRLPFAANSFDRVVTSLFLHHLNTADKRTTFEELLRVLRPGGELHVADWGKAPNLPMRVAFYAVQLLDGFETTDDNAQGRLPYLIEEAGFDSVAQTCEYMTVLGCLALYAARKPDS
jgi:ubiquinone/menaquinone biosynthesis C-methylase UbiE